jgi:hypothetical protein
MSKKILIGNRGDQRLSRAAAKLNCLARAAGRGDFNTGERNV